MRDNVGAPEGRQVTRVAGRASTAQNHQRRALVPTSEFPSSEFADAADTLRELEPGPVTAQAAMLLAGLLVAHCVADFTPLAGPRMQQAKARGGPMWLIAAHAGVHALLMVLVVFGVKGLAYGSLGLTAGLVFGTHFPIDMAKARLGIAYPHLADHGRQAFWTLFGVDQLAHILVLVLLTALLL